ncbi:hypothetical protein GW17_00045479 [Ensete ventricosum]|nr:hypothetical protein GW17_00045479 [Ensete ventricosum]RZS01210.1 hypothetical protein BHM03_00031033 [Ensete ventricosum]
MIRVTGELDCSKAHIRLREPDKLDDKAEGGYTDREERDADGTDSSTMGMETPWYRKDRTSVESTIPCSHRERALVVKGVEKVENIETNSKYQDKAESQRLGNFVRPMSMGFSSR